MMRRAILLSPGDKGFNPAFKDTSFQHHIMLALEAFNPDVGTKPDYLPFIAAAGVLFLEPDDITHPYLHGYFLS